MLRPRFSISGLMLAAGLIAFHLAVVCSYPPLLNLGRANLEIGLLPGVTVAAVMLYSAMTRPSKVNRRFVWNFLASLAAITCAYVILCIRVPELVKWPVVYYINNVEPELYDADLAIVYWLSREIDGLILGAPQLLLAIGGGLSIRAAAAETWRNASTGSASSGR